jgi:hypothetical protein
MVEEELGYQALISESISFPIETDANAIENCRRRVEQDVDILVLIIGRRYGSVESHSGRSITNIEYGAARAKGIPIYVFVDRSVLTLFEAWRVAKPETRVALGETVDDDRLFTFLEKVRSVSWTNGFEYANDITDAFRIQLAYLMMRGLMVQKILYAHPDHEILNTLLPKAFSACS